MSRSRHGALLLLLSGVLSACSVPRYGDSDSRDVHACESGPCAAEAGTSSPDGNVEGGTQGDAANAPSGFDDGGPLASSDAASQDERDARAPNTAPDASDAQTIVGEANRDAAVDAAAPDASSVSFCSGVNGGFCADFESGDPQAGFDYAALDPERATAKLVATSEPGHGLHVLELGLSAYGGVHYVHDFDEDASAIRIELDVWVKSGPRGEDDDLEIVKLQQEVPPDHYPGVSVLVNANGAGVLIGNIIKQPAGGLDYMGTTYALPALADKWTRMLLEVWPGLSGRVRVSYDGVEVLDEPGVRVASDGAIKTYASLGLYSPKIDSAAVWYDNVIVATE